MALSDLVSRPAATRVILVEAQPYDLNANSIVNVGYGWGFAPNPGAGAPVAYYSPRLKDRGVSLSRDLRSNTRLSGIVQSDGDITLLSGAAGNVGPLDPVADYVWRGRDVTVRMGGEGDAYGDFQRILAGRASDTELSETTFRIGLRDPAGAFDRQIQDRTFAGTGGAEGPSEIEGRAKPLALGIVRFIEPVALGIQDVGDGDFETFAYSDGACKGAIDVYSNGDKVTETTASSGPGSGEWKDHASLGVFQIGSSVTGLITADVEGAKDSSGTYRNTVAGLIELIHERIGATPPFAANTISDLDAKNSAPVGWYVRDNGRATDVVTSLLRTVGGYLTGTRLGELRLGRIEAPSGTADGSVGKAEIQDVTRLSTPAPAASVQVRYRRTWRVHREDDISTSLSDARKTRLRNEWRNTPKVNGVDEAVWPDAEDEVFDTAFDVAADAKAERDRLATLFGQRRDAYDVEVSGQSLLREIGDTLEATFDRFGLSNGRSLRIVGIDETSPFTTDTVTLWG